MRLVLKPGRTVQYAEHVVGEGKAFLAAAERNGLEGVVAKHKRSRYEQGRRSTTWLKLKIRAEQELVRVAHLHFEDARVVHHTTGHKDESERD